MASSSSTPPSSSPGKHEVFLSFRGEDTRNSFVSHLYTALDQRGIITYMDEYNLENGKSISPELLKSIEDSKFAIIVFSKNYASSTWCLNELVKIMECRTKYEQIVIPIFYDVDPSDVRKQKNSFGESLAQHEVDFKEDMEKVRIWKDSLREAANIAGEDLSRRDVSEASCIKKLVEAIFKKLHPQASNKGLVGIESRMAEVSSLLLREPDNICFIGIWGLGGIGKTTIARAIFEKHIVGFEGGCFLQDVSKSKSRIVNLQNTLLSKVLRMESLNISYDNEGSKMIEKRLSSKKVLLVLDDVDDITQINSLAGGREWFGRGSRIIITTRDKHLLNEVNKSYAVDLLSNDEALQLFSLHAFEKSHPTEKFDQLSDRVVSYACGLPLALVVLGSYLRGRGPDDWESALDRLKDAPEDKVFVALKISFEGLNDSQQDIFLDIACFFRGEREAEVKRKLHSFGFHPVDGITVLIQKSLIHILDGAIQMHDLIQEMGCHIVRRKANKETGRYSRLWLTDDIIDVLTSNTATGEIEGMVLQDYNRSDRLCLEGFRIANSLSRGIMLSKGAFRNMNRLRLLELYGGYFSVAPDYLPNKLRWLCWPGYPSKSLPENFQPRNLVSLKLPRSQIVQTPDISCMPNLEILDLNHCYQLFEVHPSIGVHKKLLHLDLSYCTTLRWFPRVIQMKSVEILNLSSCLKLEHSYENPDGKTIHCIDLSQPSSPKRKRTEYHAVSKNVNMLLPAFLSLPSLRKLSMENCNVLVVIFPERMARLRASLQELSLGCNKFVSLPESINQFSSLQVLNLNGCKMLGVLPELPLSIQQLVLDNCTGLAKIPYLVDLLWKYEDLHLLSLGQCWELFSTNKIWDSWKNKTVKKGVPQFLSAFWDWGSVSKVLSTKKEVVQISFPESKIPDWLTYQSEDCLTVTLSPSWYNDKLRGFALCSMSRSHNLEFPTFNGLFPKMATSWGKKHITFVYIPIGIVTNGRECIEQNECCLFEVTNREYMPPYVNKWGLRLVYEDDVDMDNIDVRVTSHYGPIDSLSGMRMKVCVARKLGENSNPCYSSGINFV